MYRLNKKTMVEYFEKCDQEWIDLIVEAKGGTETTKAYGVLLRKRL